MSRSIEQRAADAARKVVGQDRDEYGFKRPMFERAQMLIAAEFADLEPPSDDGEAVTEACDIIAIWIKTSGREVGIATTTIRNAGLINAADFLRKNNPKLAAELGIDLKRTEGQ